MDIPGVSPGRRSFLRSTAAVPFGMSLFAGAATAADDRPNVIGPKSGYSPEIGTLVSMLTWMRGQAVAPAHGLSQAQLDHLLDSRANSIGALLLHLAATETFYQLNTFEGKPWDSWSAAIKEKWNPAMELGDAGRSTIKGHNLDYYLGVLKETRERSLAEFRKRDDAWLMQVDEKWFWGPTNNFCKWFHVCEHESHHSGQMALLVSRVPGAKQG